MVVFCYGHVVSHCSRVEWAIACGGYKQFTKREAYQLKAPPEERGSIQLRMWWCHQIISLFLLSKCWVAAGSKEGNVR